jgi:tetratricopeptide (TPR) repeat protein
LLDEAARSIERLKDSDHSAQCLYLLALARRRLGDDEGYRETCALLESTADLVGDSAALVTLPWTCGLGPNALENLSEQIMRAERSVAKNPMDAPYFDLTVLGAILYRAGQYDQAMRRLQASISQFPDQPTVGAGTVLLPKLFLAMAKWQQGHRDEARRALDELQPAIDRELQSPSSLWQRRATLEVLRREAEALIKPTGANEAVENENPTPPLTPDP